VRDPKPALDAEAALNEAREHLGLLKRLGFLEPGVEGLEAHIRWRARIQLRLEAVPERPARAAAVGETIALDAAKEPLRARDVRDYLLRLLSEKPTPPPKKGRPSTEFRDFWIVQVIACLVASYSLTPTRNRVPNPTPHQQQPTACEIVAMVLDELGTSLAKTSSVEAIWSRRLTLSEALDHIIPSPENYARAEAQFARYEVGTTIRRLANIEAELAALTVRGK
jgi:hypothetical protein